MGSHSPRELKSIYCSLDSFFQIAIGTNRDKSTGHTQVGLDMIQTWK